MSPAERRCRWKTVMIRISIFFRVIAEQIKVKYLLGHRAYKQLFGQTDQEPHHYVPSLPWKYRFIKGEAVGKPLPPGQGPKMKQKAHMDPQLCQHPEADMKKGGNKDTCKWWTCARCLLRWERKSMEEVQGTSNEPTDMDYITFGKHSGARYKDVYENDQQYCQWVVNTARREPLMSSVELRRFAAYLQQTEKDNADLEQHLMWFETPLDMEDEDLDRL